MLQMGHHASPRSLEELLGRLEGELLLVANSTKRKVKKMQGQARPKVLQATNQTLDDADWVGRSKKDVDASGAAGLKRSRSKVVVPRTTTLRGI